MQMFMSYYHFMVPDTWNGFRDIDEKINFEELNRQLEEGEALAGEEEGGSPAPAQQPAAAATAPPPTKGKN